MFVEQVLDNEAVEDPFDGGGLESDERVGPGPESGAHVLEKSKRVGNVLDHMAANYSVWPHAPVRRTVKLSDELDSPVGTRIRSLVGGIETYAAVVPMRAKTLQKIASSASHLDDGLPTDAAVEEPVDETVHVRVESRRPRLVVLVVLPVLQKFGAKGGIGDETAS
jgi:hypothetical protein